MGGRVSRRRGRLRIGTSGYQYPHWRERFYPADVPKRAWFDYYAHRFDTVEVNATFYGLPAADTVYALLRRHRAALCIHDMLPDHPRAVTADWLYVRYHGQDDTHEYSSRFQAGSSTTTPTPTRRPTPPTCAATSARRDRSRRPPVLRCAV